MITTVRPTDQNLVFQGSATKSIGQKLCKLVNAIKEMIVGFFRYIFPCIFNKTPKTPVRTIPVSTVEGKTGVLTPIDIPPKTTAALKDPNHTDLGGSFIDVSPAPRLTYSPTEVQNSEFADMPRLTLLDPSHFAADKVREKWASAMGRMGTLERASRNDLEQKILSQPPGVRSEIVKGKEILPKDEQRGAFCVVISGLENIFMALKNNEPVTPTMLDFIMSEGVKGYRECEDQIDQPIDYKVILKDIFDTHECEEGSLDHLVNSLKIKAKEMPLLGALLVDETIPHNPKTYGIFLRATHQDNRYQYEYFVLNPYGKKIGDPIVFREFTMPGAFYNYFSKITAHSTTYSIVPLTLGPSRMNSLDFAAEFC